MVGGGGEGQAFSGLQQALTTTPGYNQRVNECEEAAAALARAEHGGRGGEAACSEGGERRRTTVLSDVSVTQFREHATVLSAAQLKRATHFFGECARVQQGVQAWRSGDVELFGRLMNESGLSSIHNYQCGCVLWPQNLLRSFERRQGKHWRTSSSLREVPGVRARPEKRSDRG